MKTCPFRNNNQKASAISREEQLQFLRQSARLEESAAPVFVRGAMAVLVAFVILFIIWTIFTDIDEISQASGEVVPSGFVQIVQHFDGGIVKEIFINEGSKVNKDDLLILLDGAGTEEDLRKAIIAKDGLEHAANTAREMFAIQKSLKEQGVSSQVKYLEAKQINDQAESELEQQKEVVERLNARVKRLEIRAPVSGLIKGLKLNTIGGVVKSGEPIMEIVPTDEKLVVEARILPIDIGYVAVGQPVKVKVSSFDYGRFGAVDGTLEFITATTFDGPNGDKYYRARIILKQDYVGEHKSMKIIPGMTVQAGIITGKKSVFSYLFKPVQRALQDGLSER